jgi:hypothetical protein
VTVVGWGLKVPATASADFASAAAAAKSAEQAAGRITDPTASAQADQIIGAVAAFIASSTAFAGVTVSATIAGHAGDATTDMTSFNLSLITTPASTSGATS